MVIWRVHIVVSIIDWTEEGKKILGLKPSIVTSDDLKSIRNIAILRYATSLFKPNDWIKVIEGLVKKGYLISIKEVLYSRENGEIFAIVDGYTVTENGRKVAEEISEMIRKYGGENDFMYGIGYYEVYLAELHLRAVAFYLSHLCHYKYYMERDEEGKRCMERLRKVDDFVERELKKYKKEFKYFEPLALYLLFTR